MAAKKTAKKATESAPAKKTAAKEPAKKAAAKKATEKKAPATKVAKKAVAAEGGASSTIKAKKVTPSRPSPDALARAAYLNYRRRVEQGLPGDAHQDWVEAEKQLGGI